MHYNKSLLDYFWEEPLEILSLSDYRLVYIDTREEGFYDNVLNYVTENPCVVQFQEIVSIVKKLNLPPFFTTRFMPFIQESSRFKPKRRDESEREYKMHKKLLSFSRVAFSKDAEKNVTTYGNWEKLVIKMQSVEKRNWHIGNEYQYCAFIVYLINSIAEMYSISKSIEMVLLNSNELIPEKITRYVRETPKFGFSNLITVPKLIRCTNGNAGEFFMEDPRFTRRLFSLVKIENVKGIETDNITRDSRNIIEGTAFLVLE